MPIKLDDIQLDHVHCIETLEQNNFVYHQIPGRQGSVAQGLGRSSVRLRLQGICYGIKALERLEKLRKISSQQKPVIFAADIIGQAYFSKVIVEQFEVIQSTSDPEQFSYNLTVVEFAEPASGGASQDIAGVSASVKNDAASLMNAADLPDALQMGFMPEVTNPVEPLKASLEPVKEAITGLDDAVSDLKSLFAL